MAFRITPRLSFRVTGNPPGSEHPARLGSAHAHRSSWCSRPRAPAIPGWSECQCRIRADEWRWVIESSCLATKRKDGDPNYEKSKYAYYRENANPSWGLSVGLTVKNFYSLDFSMIFEKLCNVFVRPASMRTFHLTENPFGLIFDCFSQRGFTPVFLEQETRLPRLHGLSIHTDSVMAIEGIPRFTG